MESKLRKPSYKYMHVILNQCVRGRMAQAMFAVFLYSSLRIILFLFGISLTASSFASQGGPSPLSACLGLLTLLLANVSGELLSYGLYSVLSPLVRNRASSIKNLFSGFRDRKGSVVRAAWTFTAIHTAAILAVGILYAALSGLLPGPVQEGSPVPQAGKPLLVAALAFIALTFLLTFPFSFSYLTLHTRPDLKARESFAVSWKLLRRQPFHFIGFVLYAGGSDLAAALILQLALFVLPSGEGAAPSLQLLSTLASFIALVAQYRAMSRCYLAVCIYFLSEAGILHPHGGPDGEP